MWKDMLDTPEMQQLLSDPDQMRQMMTPFVEMMGGDKGKLEEVLSDPNKLKSSMTQGLEVRTIKVSWFPMSSLTLPFSSQDNDPAIFGSKENGRHGFADARGALFFYL